VAEWKPRARGRHPLYNRLCGEFHNAPRHLAEMFHAARVATTSRPRPHPRRPRNGIHRGHGDFHPRCRNLEKDSEGSAAISLTYSKTGGREKKKELRKW
jgi:hypothetical protein